MNLCEERHSPTYKIIYKGFKGSKYNPEWLVCSICFEKYYFNDKDQILKVLSV